MSHARLLHWIYEKSRSETGHEMGPLKQQHRGQRKAQEEVLHECKHARWILLQQQKEEEEEGEG